MLNRLIIIFYCVLVSPAALQAQGGFSIKAAADKNKILIGEQLQLTVEISFPAGTAVSFPPVDSMEHFEVVGKPVTDTVAGNTISTIKSVYTITSFDSGSWAIPSFSIAKDVRSDSIPVEVAFSEFDPNKPYHDITDVEDVPVKEKKNPWWWYAAGAAVLLAVLLLIFRKRKPAMVPVIKTEKPIDPYKEAMRQLEELVLRPGPQKEFYSSLTDIFRLYVYRKKGILSLQKTTDDLVLQLKSTGLGREEFDRLSQVLRVSDFVKFAKYIPGAEDDKKSLEDIRESVKAIEKQEQNNITGENRKGQ